ncbi:MAG: twin-arginine translocase TatA/TatE family subunit [Rhodospirillaceae bacterium]|jgi:sec-independent protein translocase protein TatA|nr:twin-arginine translocase TatA/TatE family subunit [Rhodospirillaceae bacterium]MBT5243295.1 twin-arginine translocase TatA/TatE family subunit [Rhodospirillaceae bacterium]MBT5563921.1 twin-arginine translocase TatA/TatE family subunit [Rhodospirillaceae bacterium]MBT6240875.1 twin-arginine translocase TatA/TatE family subunit [Rhodospirillaceae bacterium]MBT7137342.1 twin-arginine translocase TatA/TatE family subunit [Rhodospirillaceae bacterium]
MGAFSIWHWVIVLAVVLVLFGGKGKISALMGDFGKGLKSFKKGMKDEDGDDAKASEDAPKLSEKNSETVDQAASEEKKSD